MCAFNPSFPIALTLAMCLVAGASDTALAKRGSGQVWSFTDSNPSSTAHWSKASNPQQLRSFGDTEHEKQAHNQSAESPSPFDVSVEDHSISWHGETPVEKTGETRVFEKRHLFRTHASGLVTDNVHMSLGPEMLFREKHVVKEGIADSAEPETSLGFGMRFQVEF